MGIHDEICKVGQSYYWFRDHRGWFHGPFERLAHADDAADELDESLGLPEDRASFHFFEQKSYETVDEAYARFINEWGGLEYICD